jgi:hypothetical protein
MGKKQRSKSAPSLVIPIVVGLVVVAVIVGAIISIENRRSAAAAVPGGSVASAQPLNTGSLPYPEVPRATVAETVDKLEQGQAVLIDVRSGQSFDKAHAAGAVSIPEEELNIRIQELPRDKDLILYCT